MSYALWHESIWPEVVEVHNLMSKPFSDEPVKLIADMIETESKYARMGFILAEADSHLDEATHLNMPSKEEKITEMERRAKLDDLVKDIREMRDKVESLRDAIKQRISLGQSILSYERATMEARIQAPKNLEKVY